MSLKLTILGDLSCGKTSLLNRYLTNTFNLNYIETLGVSLRTSYLNLEGVRV